MRAGTPQRSSSIRELPLAAFQAARDVAVRVALEEVLSVDDDEERVPVRDALIAVAQLGGQPQLAPLGALAPRGHLVAPADEARALVVDLEPAGHGRAPEPHQQHAEGVVERRRYGAAVREARRALVDGAERHLARDALARPSPPPRRPPRPRASAARGSPGCPGHSPCSWAGAAGTSSRWARRRRPSAREPNGLHAIARGGDGPAAGS